MKKSTIKKFPSVKKNSTFRALWGYYRRAQRDFLLANKRNKETKKAYENLKGDESASKSSVKAWKAEVKRARKNKDLKQVIVKEARRHVKKWLKAFQAWQVLADGRSKLKKSKPESKKKTTVKKVAKPAKSKKETKPKTAKKTSPKPKAAPAKPKLVIAKKIRVASPPKLKPSTTAKTKAKPAVKPVAKKRTVRKTTAAAKPKTTATRKPAPRRTTRTTPAVKPRTARVRQDNLKRVEGIGVKIEQLLRNAGIDSFEKLSKSTLTTLRGLLAKAGPHFKASDPTTWSKQARLAAQGKWEELKKWQGELKGGRIVK